ncbi:hypothetical protein M426DRAFT_11545 [Hypoxylon sp. CI-4A]|nr:hypothetical protein M426DRAFT_11545 [Hypoxylon sp. CI-4A]
MTSFPPYAFSNFGGFEKATKYKDPKFRLARDAWRYAKNHFELFSGGTLQYVRVVGFGGFGIAQKWQQFDESGKYIRDVVIKIPIETGNKKILDEFKNEMYYMGERFKNAQHIVQLVDLNSETLLHQTRNYNNPDSAAVPMMVMENMANGNLRNLLDKLYDSQKYNALHQDAPIKIPYVPARVLWRFFLCLVRGCIAMAYSEQLSKENPDGPWKESVPDPQNPEPVFPDSKFIHFDLDPQNVLVGIALEDDEHSFNPILKINDFGLSEIWDDKRSLARKLRHILRGKWAYYTPEQRDTSMIWNTDKNVNDPGYRMNIWAIGAIMSDLVWVRHPQEGTWEPQEHVIPKLDDDGNYKQVRMMTYGSHLLPPPTNKAWSEMYFDEGLVRSYPRNLRALIARCLAVNPGDRPSLVELENIVVGCITAIEEEAERLTEEGHVTPDRGAEMVWEDKTFYSLDFLIPPPFEYNALIEKFYVDHFLDAPEKGDPYESDWSKETPPPGGAPPVPPVPPAPPAPPAGPTPANVPNPIIVFGDTPAPGYVSAVPPGHTTSPAGPGNPFLSLPSYI